MPTKNPIKAAEVNLNSLDKPIEAPDLKQQLVEILEKKIVWPKEPIFGTQLLKRVRPELRGSFSDASIKNYFSTLSRLENSPIAKTTQGFGYFKRQKISDIEAVDELGQKLDVVSEDDAVISSSRSEQDEEKFRAIYMVWLESNKIFPAHIEHTKSLKSIKGANLWKFPDVVSLSWNIAVSSESSEELLLDKNLLEIKKSIGDSPFTLASIELKVNLTFANFRQFFFQCVSNSKWANEAHLVVAQKITDAKLVDSLRKLGSSFGVSIISFGLSEEEISGMPSAEQTKLCDLDGKDSLLQKYCNKVDLIYSASINENLDWDHIKDIRDINADFNSVFFWVSRCLKDNKAHSINEFKGLHEIDRRAWIAQKNDY